MRIPLFGKRGLIGVAVIAFGLWMILDAREDAEHIWKETWSAGADNVLTLNAIAKDAGYESYMEYLVGKNRHSGGACVAVGAALLVWGFWKHGRKKPQPASLVMKSPVGKAQGEQSTAE